MVNIVTEKTSKRIISLRYVLIVFVVFIHADLKPEMAINYYHYDFVQPYWIEVLKNFICNTLGGAAVPLFFFFASFLQFSKNDTYVELLKKRSNSLLLPYGLWTCITITLYFFAQSIPQTAVYFQNSINLVKNWQALDWIKAFTYHNFEGSLKHPLVYQFWFLRELMIFIILSPILKFLCNKIPGAVIIGILTVALKGFPLIFTVSSSALFFYLTGYFFAKYKFDFFKIADSIKFIEYLILLCIMMFFDIYLDGKYHTGLISVIVSCLFFLKVSSYFVKNEAVFSKLKYLSGFSFFLYAVHTPFLGTAVNKITQRIIPLYGILCLVQFLLAALLTTVIGTLLGIILKKICLPVFALLNGGRQQ